MFFSASPIIRLISGRWLRKALRGSSGCSRGSPGASLDLLVPNAPLATRLENEADLMPALRRAKREAALLVALADVGGVWDVVAATRGADPFRRRRCPRLARVLGAAQACARRTLGARRGSARHRERLGPRGVGARQARRARAQLLERHRPHCPLRPSRDIDPGKEPSQAPCSCVRPRRLRACFRSGRAKAMKLRVDLRLRPYPASTQVALSNVKRLSVLKRDGRPELGACGALIKGSSGGGATSSLANASWRTSHHSSGASISITRRSQGHPRDEAPDPCRAWPRASRRAWPRCQNLDAAASARSSFSSRHSSLFLQRTAPPDARIAHPRHAAAIVRRQVDQRGRGS